MSKHSPSARAGSDVRAKSRLGFEFVERLAISQSMANFEFVLDNELVATLERETPMFQEQILEAIFERAKSLKVRAFLAPDWHESTKGRDVGGAIILAASEYCPKGYDLKAHRHTRFPKVRELKCVFQELNPSLSDADALIASRVVIRANDSNLVDVAWKVARFALAHISGPEEASILTALFEVFPATLRESPEQVTNRYEQARDHLSILRGNYHPRAGHSGPVDEYDYPPSFQILIMKVGKLSSNEMKVD